MLWNELKKTLWTERKQKAHKIMNGITLHTEETIDLKKSQSDSLEASVPSNKVNCEMCESTASKYTCPGCGVKTCSLPCVRQHKTNLGCNGERDKSAFVDMSQYTDRHLLNDYRFLEDAERRLYSNKMVPENKRRVVHGAPYHLSKRSKLLVTAAYKRGIKLQMVSPALTKNKSNTSFYTISTDTVGWHIEWLFVTSGTVVKDEKVSETTVLLEAARKFTNFVEYPHLRKPLEDYKKDKLDQCRFLLKLSGLPANRTRYFELKSTSTIADNLKGHCLTEYPSIVVLPSCDDSDDKYPLLSKGQYFMGTKICNLSLSPTRKGSEIKMPVGLQCGTGHHLESHGIGDLPFMDAASARHMSSHFPDLDVNAEIESQLLDPKSQVYSV